MKEFFKRNAPVFLIGIVTVGVFVTIIFAASKNPSKGPSLQEIKDEQFITDSTAIIGPRDSKVVLVEFSDFECPACKAFHPTMQSLIDKYKDRVLFAYKHFPLPQHRNARSAAIAAIAAQEQGSFWNYADKLFDAQPDFSREKFIQLAGELNLDKDKFNQALDNADLAKRVDDDLAQANRLGLAQTPSFILNNKLMSLTAFEDLEKQLVAELEKNGIQTTTPQPDTNESSPSQDQTTNLTPNEMDAKYGTIDIDYSFTGFIPNNAKALVGQQVRIRNTIKTEMRLQQIIALYNEIDNPYVIKPGETLSVRLTKEGLWTFKEVDHKHYGSVFAVAQ
jgi:protein-disulfide isomerase